MSTEFGDVDCGFALLVAQSGVRAGIKQRLYDLNPVLMRGDHKRVVTMAVFDVDIDPARQQRPHNITNP